LVDPTRRQTTLPAKKSIRARRSRTVVAMRKTPSVVEVRDRTTLPPSAAPLVAARDLGLVIDALFDLHERPHDRQAKIRLALLRKQGAAACPTCADDVTLEGFRRTQTSYLVRDEWRCRCGARFLLAEEHVC
jgi:hypothetical protein